MARPGVSYLEIKSRFSNALAQLIEREAKRVFWPSAGIDQRRPLEKRDLISSMRRAGEPFSSTTSTRFCHLALQHNLPLVIHCREALQSYLRPSAPMRRNLKKHLELSLFTGTWEEATHWLECGWMISFSGSSPLKSRRRCEMWHGAFLQSFAGGDRCPLSGSHAPSQQTQ